MAVLLGRKAGPAVVLFPGCLSTLQYLYSGWFDRDGALELVIVDALNSTQVKHFALLIEGHRALNGKLAHKAVQLTVGLIGVSKGLQVAGANRGLVGCLIYLSSTFDLHRELRQVCLATYKMFHVYIFEVSVVFQL